MLIVRCSLEGVCNYLAVPDHCFYINKNQFTWQQAKESCEYIQSRLAYPNSTEDVIFFQQIGAQHEYWVGGNDQEQEGLWKTETDQVYQGLVLHERLLIYINYFLTPE